MAKPLRAYDIGSEALTLARTGLFAFHVFPRILGNMENSGAG
jgi:hypothetical protein